MQDVYVHMNKVRLAYQRQKWRAKKRGIRWRFTFQDWVACWEVSLGPNWFEMRGPTAGKFVMARDGDRGPYSRNNVRIVPCEVNHKEAVLNGRSPAGERNGTTVLTNELVKQVFLAEGTNAEIARRFNIPPQRVCKIKRRTAWKSVTEGL